MSRLGLQSLWCAPTIAVYEDPGCQHTKSACSDPSGRMVRVSTSPGKHFRRASPALIPLQQTKTFQHPIPENPSQQHHQPSGKAGLYDRKSAATTDKGGQGTPSLLEKNKLKASYKFNKLVLKKKKKNSWRQISLFHTFCYVKYNYFRRSNFVTVKYI